MPRAYTPRQGVEGLAKATPSTGVPHCATPGCGAHAVVRAEVDVHHVWPPWAAARATAPYCTTYLACLPCYGRLRRLQAEAGCEIVAVEAV